MTHPQPVVAADTTAAVLCVGVDEATFAGVASLTQLRPVACKDPYAAMCAVAGSPAAWRMVVVDLQQLYDSELAMISAVRAVAPQCRVVMARTDGRPAMLARAIRLGIDGLLTGGKIEWLTTVTPAGHTPAGQMPAAQRSAITEQHVEPLPEPATSTETAPLEQDERADHAELRSVADIYQDEPLLTADELKALLSDHDIRPTAS